MLHFLSRQKCIICYEANYSGLLYGIAGVKCFGLFHKYGAVYGFQ